MELNKMKRFECKNCGHFRCVVFGTEVLSNKSFECKENIFKTKWYEIDEEEEKAEEKAEELPSWCKKGEMVYYTKGKLYCEIHVVDEKRGILLFNSEYLITDFVSISELDEARLRPFNEKEMRELVGKTIANKTTKTRYLIVTSNSTCVSAAGYIYNKEELFDNFTFTDGTPCGVYEHFENGEWVK
jgi:hypothetical protein